MKGDKGKMQSHYERGVIVGRQFIRAIRENKISREELASEVPIGVTMRLGGASDDIMIGRILEAAIGDAYDSIVQRDSSGIPLPTSEWVTDESLKAAKANAAYEKSNCDLVR